MANPNAGPSENPRALTPPQQVQASRYVPLAKSLAKPFKKSWPSQADEFESAALYGLTLAAGRYDPALPLNFGPYARGAVVSALLDTGRRLACQPRAVRLTEATDCPDNRQPDRPPDLEFVGWCLARLEGRQAAVCRRIYLEGQTQAEAARALHVSRRTVLRWHRAALSTLLELLTHGPIQ